MKRMLIGCLLVLAGACAGEKYRGVPVHYHPLLDSALAKAGDNAPELVKALASVPGTMREGMAFLVAYMPERDLRTLRAPELSTNVELAYAARNRFSWAREVPDSIFLNDVLPYAILNETRENWRVDFYRRFAPLVEGCTTLAEAISIVNARVRDELKVDYNTRRRRPDQSPSESIEQGMASCSGLSILLTDAFRSVGIPSRVAGTANWHDQRGNHTWSEVWLDGRWYFTEYYPEELDRAWFLADAGRAIPGDRDYAVWASSFKPTGTSFPLVWDFSIDYVPALDVTRRYVDVYREVFSTKTTDGEHVTLRVLAFKNGRKSARSADRLQLNVDIFHGASQVGGGSTAGPTRDMNDVLEFLVEKNKDYTLKYWLPDGTGKELTIPVKSVPLEVILN